MMFASGVLANSPSSARLFGTCWSAGRTSLHAARMRPANEMSRVSTSTPAVEVKASTIGSREYVASSGASSVRV